MAGNLSNYLENKLLEHIVGKAQYAKPDAYVALFTDVPTDEDAGIEVSGGAYTRLSAPSAAWNAASDGSITNAVDLEWPLAGGSWGTVEGIAIMDAPTGGNVLVYGTAQTPKTIEEGDTYRISAGNLTLTLN